MRYSILASVRKNTFVDVQINSYILKCIYSKMQKEDGMIKTSFKLSKKLLKKAKRYAIDHDKSENDIFTEALAEFLSIREEGETN